MNALLRHALEAWQPLRQRGMLVDGVYRRPNVAMEVFATRVPGSKPHPRLLLLAWTGLWPNLVRRKP